MAQKLALAGAAPQWDEELRLWLEKYLKDHAQLNTIVLGRADHIGFSRTGLDEYLAGTYFQPKVGRPGGVKKSRIEDLIRAYRERVEGTTRHGYSNQFVETMAWRQFQHACTTAITENVIVVAYARPGVGKSRCLTEFAVRHLSTGAIRILCSANITTRYFVQKLAREMGLDDRVPTARLEDAIAEKLKRHPRPVFIDQANYLNEKGLGTICYLWEIARVPFVLIGTKDLYDLFNTSRLTEDVRAQLSSRVAMHYPLRTLGQMESKAIIERALGVSATPDVIARIQTVTGGIHRHLDMVLPRIKEVLKINEKELAAGDLQLGEVIDAAGARLMAS